MRTATERRSSSIAGATPDSGPGPEIIAVLAPNYSSERRATRGPARRRALRRIAALRQVLGRERPRQPERNRRKDSEHRKQHEIRDDERRDAAVDRAHRNLTRESMQQEHDHADRRDDHAE